MRIVTWNVNSIGARLERVLAWLELHQPDVLALQELKCTDAAFPLMEIQALGYEVATWGTGRWNGVALLSKVGLALHLPIAQPADEISPRGVESSTGRVRETLRWGGNWAAELEHIGGPEAACLWVSHLDDSELGAVVRSCSTLSVRPRIGTRLWLDRTSLKARGTVLAVHPLPNGTHVGYRQRSGPRDGTLVVVSGGTSHGIGLSAPSPASSVRQRVVTAGTGALDAAGRAMSPFTCDGKQRWFAEAPHAQVSMIWLPRGAVIPTVGDQLTADVRFTTSHFDAIIGLN